MKDWRQPDKSGPQMDRTFAAFCEQPKTMLQVSIETEIYRANITRYIAKWRKQGLIKLVKVGLCPISKHRAGFYKAGRL